MQDETPDETGRRSSYLNKVRALLSQAEDPACTPEEAKLFSEKAQQLMEKYSFSLIELEALGQRQRDEIVHVNFFVEAPYAKAKQDLWYRISEANHVKLCVSDDVKRHKWEKQTCDEYGCNGTRYDGEPCKGVHSKTVYDAKGKAVKGGYVYLTGFRSDIDTVETLFTSLLVQSTNEILKAEKNDWENTRSFRNAFLHGYSHAIGARLHAARVEAQKQEVQRFEEESSINLLPVLADRQAQVDAEFERQYGGTVKGSVSMTYSRRTNGYSSGRSAAGRADIGSGRLGSQKALSR